MSFEKINRNYSYSKSNRTPIAIEGVNLTNKEVDSLLEQVSDLGVNPSFIGYCVNRLRAIGPTLFLEAADYARKHGRYKDRCFIQRIKA